MVCIIRSEKCDKNNGKGVELIGKINEESIRNGSKGKRQPESTSFCCLVPRNLDWRAPSSPKELIVSPLYHLRHIYDSAYSSHTFTSCHCLPSSSICMPRSIVPLQVKALPLSTWLLVTQKEKINARIAERKQEACCLSKGRRLSAVVYLYFQQNGKNARGPSRDKVINTVFWLLIKIDRGSLDAAQTHFLVEMTMMKAEGLIHRVKYNMSISIFSRPIQCLSQRYYHHIHHNPPFLNHSQQPLHPLPSLPPQSLSFPLLPPPERA